MDISDYIEADLGRNQEYWKVQCGGVGGRVSPTCMHLPYTLLCSVSSQDMQIICEDELHKLKQLDPEDPGTACVILSDIEGLCLSLVSCCLHVYVYCTRVCVCVCVCACVCVRVCVCLCRIPGGR